MYTSVYGLSPCRGVYFVVEGEYEDIVAVLPKKRAVKDRDCKTRRGERKAMNDVWSLRKF